MLHGHADRVSRLSVCVTNNRTLLKKRDIYSRSNQIGLSLIPPLHSFTNSTSSICLKFNRCTHEQFPCSISLWSPRPSQKGKKSEYVSCQEGIYALYMWMFADLHKSQQLRRGKLAWFQSRKTTDFTVYLIILYKQSLLIRSVMVSPPHSSWPHKSTLSSMPWCGIKKASKSATLVTRFLNSTRRSRGQDLSLSRPMIFVIRRFSDSRKRLK